MNFALKYWIMSIANSLLRSAGTLLLGVVLLALAVMAIKPILATVVATVAILIVLLVALRILW